MKYTLKLTKPQARALIELCVRGISAGRSSAEEVQVLDMIDELDEEVNGND